MLLLFLFLFLSCNTNFGKTINIESNKTYPDYSKWRSSEEKNYSNEIAVIQNSDRGEYILTAVKDCWLKYMTSFPLLPQFPITVNDVVSEDTNMALVIYNNNEEKLITRTSSNYKLVFLSVIFCIISFLIYQQQKKYNLQKNTRLAEQHIEFSTTYSINV